jgi:hypothetical protein
MGTNFQKNSRGHYLFEDNVYCKYNDAFTKAKLFEAALSISDLVGQIDYKG